MTTRITRKKDKGLPGNGGQFATPDRAEADASVRLEQPASNGLPQSLTDRGVDLEEVAGRYFDAAFYDTERAVEDGMYDDDIDTQTLSINNLASDVYETVKEDIRRFLTDNETDILLALDDGMETRELPELLYSSRSNGYPSFAHADLGDVGERLEENAKNLGDSRNAVWVDEDGKLRL